jgi:hypothetical protein
MSDLRAGAAKLDITPRIGVELCGYGAFLGRRSTTIHDPLYCRALVLEHDQGWVVIIENDLIGITADTATTTRRALRERLGIAEDHVLIACSHTHSGPNTIHLIGWGEADPSYVSDLPGLMVTAVEQAAAALRPARLGTGRGLLENIASNRVQTTGTGLVDPELTVIRVDDTQGHPLAAIVHFSAHPVTLGPVNTQISGDFAGAACRRLEQQLGEGVVTLFLNGASGDINVEQWGKNAEEGFPLVEEYGHRVADAAVIIAQDILSSSAPLIAAAGAVVQLPLSVPDRAWIDAEVEAGMDQSKERLLVVRNAEFYQQWHAEMTAKLRNPPSLRAAELQVLKLGDCVLAVQPAELFTYFGLLIKQRSPHRRTVVVGYANDSIGYIPRPRDYTEPGFGGYAARLAPKILGNFEFQPKVGYVLTDALLDLLGTV